MTKCNSTSSDINNQPKKVGRKKLTTESFIARCKKQYGDLFDYSAVVYQGALTNIEVKCCKCSTVFYPTPANHYNSKSGCPSCNKGAKTSLTQKDFITKAIAIHGEKYNYSKSIYINSRSKINITCVEHGEFSQLAKAHLQGYGCPECGNLKVLENNKKQSMSFEDFEIRANEVHGNLFRYNKDSYISARGKVDIECNKHGWFFQRGLDHLRGTGCRQCYLEKRRSAPKEIKLVQPKKKAIVDMRARAEKEHAKILLIRERKRKDRENAFIEKANDVHSSRYSYENVVYEKMKTAVNITCSIHGDFSQRMEKHLSGRGCPQCGADESCGWSRSSYVDMCKARGNGTASLYVVRMTSKSESFIKIGITHKTIKERFSGNDKVPYDIDSLYIIEGSAGYIFDLEKKLHRLVSKYNYKPNLKFGGHTECFTTIKPIEKLLKRLTSTEQIQLIA